MSLVIFLMLISLCNDYDWQKRTERSEPHVEIASRTCKKGLGLDLKFELEKLQSVLATHERQRRQK